MKSMLTLYEYKIKDTYDEEMPMFDKQCLLNVIGDLRDQVNAAQKEDTQ